jgi:hypothetical protein
MRKYITVMCKPETLPPPIPPIKDPEDEMDDLPKMPDVI